MDRIFIRFLAFHLALGVAIGWAFVALILLMDIGGLRTLMHGSPDRWMALVLLLAFSAITFGSAAMGSAIMALGDDGGARKGANGSKPKRATSDTPAAAMVEARGR